MGGILWWRKVPSNLVFTHQYRFKIPDSGAKNPESGAEQNSGKMLRNPKFRTNLVSPMKLFLGKRLFHCIPRCRTDSRRWICANSFFLPIQKCLPSLRRSLVYFPGIYTISSLQENKLFTKALRHLDAFMDAFILL